MCLVFYELSNQFQSFAVSLCIKYVKNRLTIIIFNINAMVTAIFPFMLAFYIFLIELCIYCFINFCIVITLAFYSFCVSNIHLIVFIIFSSHTLELTGQIFYGRASTDFFKSRKQSKIYDLQTYLH